MEREKYNIVKNLQLNRRHNLFHQLQNTKRQRVPKENNLLSLPHIRGFKRHK